MGLRLAMLGDSCGGRIGLLAADGDSSPIARFIEARGEGLHHICLYVDNLDKRWNRSRAKASS
jgi:hypothetical protein